MENHYFVTNDPALMAYGMGSFSKNTVKTGLKKIYDDGDKISEEEFYTNTIQGMSSLADDAEQSEDESSFELLDALNLDGSWTATTFNSNSKTETKKTYSWQEVKDLIDDFEEQMEKLILQPEDRDDESNKRKEVKKFLRDNIAPIKAGQEKCLTIYQAPLWEKESDDDTVYYVELHFTLPSERNNQRVVGQKGRPVIAEVGRRATGATYSLSKTRLRRVIDGEFGVFVDADAKDGSVTGDLASGPMRISYNEGLGMWESAQTILARLITDVSAPENANFQMPPESDGYIEDEEFDASKFYDTADEFYGGGFTTGVAVPVQSHAKNPHMFGPNIRIDSGGKKVEKIRVVNRSAKTFTAGTLVLCTLIGAEWIIQEFSDPGNLDTSASFGAWTFSKLIANGDSFFREKDGGSLVDVGDYEARARKAWYDGWKSAQAGGTPLLAHHDGNTIYNKNISMLQSLISAVSSAAQGNVLALFGGAAFNLSNNYFSSTSFDSVDYYTGVNNMDSLDAKYPQWGVEGNSPEVKTFWGPLFPDGYVAKPAGESTAAYGINSDKYFFSTEIPSDLKQLPADIAVNGPYRNGTYQSPILPIDYFQSQIEANGFYAATKAYLGTTVNNPTYKDGFGYVPSNPKRLQFTALSAEAVIGGSDRSDFTTGAFAGSDSRKGTFLQAVYDYANKEEVASGHTFGHMKARHGGESLKYDDDLQYIPNTSTPSDFSPLWETGVGDGTNGLHVVGITSAINKIKKPGGGTVNIDVNQMFGLQVWKTTVVSQSDNTFFLPIGGGFGGGSVSTNTTGYCKNQWGSRNDKYNDFGTTALHARVYDGWPNEDTIWDTRYFSALHFNPTKEDEDGVCEVDFPVPTLQDGGIASVGTNPNNVEFKDKSDWAMDTIRRGMLLTNGGFAYGKLTLGLDVDNAIIAKAGEEAVDGTIDNVPKGYSLTVTTSGGAVTGISANTIPANASSWANFLNTIGLGEPLEGEDFSASNFESEYTDDSGTVHKGFIIDYADAVIVIPGIVKMVNKVDPAPRQHGGISRLTDASNPIEDRGCNNNKVTGVKTSELTLEYNDQGEYDLFLFFHNDITHSWINNSYPSANPPLINDPQFVSITIS